MRHWLALLSLAALGGFGCSARVACEGGAGQRLTNELPPASVVLSEASNTARFRLRAELAGLPELWQADSAIFDGELSLTLGLAYEGEPVGGDGRTEMPRVGVKFTPDPLPYLSGNQTAPFPLNPAGTFDVPLFEKCLNEEVQGCCQYGARECSVPVEVELERLDGAPFPPLVVDASFKATAAVSGCPLNESSATLSLSSEE